MLPALAEAHTQEENDRIFYAAWPLSLCKPPLARGEALWLDDTRTAPDGWERVYNAHQAIVALDTKVYEIASLDHDLEYALQYKELTGLVVVEWMVEHNVWPTEAVYVHSWNPEGAFEMARLINEHGPYERLVRPTPAMEAPFDVRDDSTI